MKRYIKIIWILDICMVFLSLIWYLFGSTALFNKEIDVIGTTVYIIFWFPALFFNIISVLVLIILLIKDMIPRNIMIQIGMVFIITMISLFFSKNLIESTNTSGWLTDKVYNDYTQLTSDGRYEYKLQLINIFQKNSSAQLYVKDISTDQENIFQLDIQTSRIENVNDAYENEDDPEMILELRLSELIPSDVQNVYILTTTKELKNKIYRFEIDMGTETVKRVENKKKKDTFNKLELQ